MIQLFRRQFGIYTLLMVSVLCLGAMSARADISISEPTDGATVRGEINVRFSGVPDGGYVIVKVDGNFMQATSQSSFSLNTFDAQSFGISQNAQTDGPHQISITGVDASGKSTSTATVSFTVANNQVDVTAPSVQLTHWVPADRLEESAQRYRIFAESNAVISSDKGGSGGGGGMPGGVAGGTPDAGAAGGGASSGGSAGWLPSPLDWQYSALLRRVVRDVGLYNGAANIKISIAEAFQRRREGQGGGSGAGAGAGEMPGGAPGIVNTSTQETASVNSSGVASKAPWSKTWQVAPESGTYFVKAIEPDGEEINATRKKRSIAVTDLLPLFPKEKVQPGSRWETLMTFLSDLSTRNPFNVKAPITFTGYEDIKLPSGEVRHAAKLESRFTLNQDQNGSVVRKMAAGLAVHGGIAGGGSSAAASGGAGADMGMGGAMGAAGGSAAGNDDAQIEAMQDNIASATIRASRVIWFDVDLHRVLRSQDQINTFFEMKQTTQSQGGGEGAVGAPPGMAGLPGMPGGEAGAAAAAPAEPTRVNYTLNVVTWYDDTIPPPTDQYNGGRGTPHSKDNVQEPSLSKVTGKF